MRLLRAARAAINRELVMYGIVGALTTVLNIALFELFLALGVDYRLGNTIAIVLTIIAAYFANKAFVFRTECGSVRAFLGEFSRFILTRSGTMAVEWVGLIVLVDRCGVSKTAGKIAVTVVVVILNYILGKLCVFTRGTSRTRE